LQHHDWQRVGIYAHSDVGHLDHAARHGRQKRCLGVGRRHPHQHERAEPRHDDGDGCPHDDERQQQKKMADHGRRKRRSDGGPGDELSGRTRLP
jgi:hypothetical protein